MLHKNHFDLGLLRTSGSVQAVFQVGKEWDDALRRLLSFIRSRSVSLLGVGLVGVNGERVSPPPSPLPCVSLSQHTGVVGHKHGKVEIAKTTVREEPERKKPEKALGQAKRAKVGSRKEEKHTRTDHPR